MFTMKTLHLRGLSGLFLTLIWAALPAAHAAAPKGFTAEKTEHGATIKFNGAPLAEYVIDQANKPYLFPVHGPTGKAMTRAFPMQVVAGEQHDHPHHRGINFGHQDIGGFDSWSERASFGAKTNAATNPAFARLGAIQHRAFKELSGDAHQATLVTENDYVNHDGKKLFSELRRLTFRAEGDTRIIDFDQEFTATEGPLVFGDQKDAGLSIRVPTSMAVDTKKGGHIITSAGLTDGDAWGKRAKWVDYHGPVAGETLGVAMLNHPSSFRHPTSWHVRTYGLFTANPFGTLDKTDPNGPHTLPQGEKLRLRHRFILHTGDEQAAKIAEAYERYAAEK